jgi:DNA-binding response OmpR family regulator
VKTATCGYDAGLLTQQFRPDVIVIDYVLNDINANVVCKAIRSNPGLEDTRIIIISGLIEDDKIQGLYDLGVDVFMRKPFQIDELIGKIAELLKI